jgi:hypothetical protein
LKIKISYKSRNYQNLSIPASPSPRWEKVKMWSKALLITGLAWAIGLALAWLFRADILALFRRS